MIEVPETFFVKITYIDGSFDKLELKSHFYNKETNLLEFWTKDNICNWVPMNNVQRLEFDENFSKIVEIRRKLEKEKNDTTG